MTSSVLFKIEIKIEIALIRFEIFLTLGYKIRKVASGRFAFHTPVFQTIRAEVIDAMGFIGTKSRPNSWISTSYSPSQQPELIGPGFFADNLANPVFFQQNISNIPQDSVIIGMFVVQM